MEIGKWHMVIRKVTWDKLLKTIEFDVSKLVIFFVRREKKELLLQIPNRDKYLN